MIENRGKRASLRSSLASLGFKAKIYLAMGSLCTLLAIIAVMSLNIIAGNLSSSREFSESGNLLLDDVLKVSASMKKTLEEQLDQQARMVGEQNAKFKESISQRVALYERILSTQNIMSAVERNANRIITAGESYAVVADEVTALRAELDLFFSIPELQAVEEKKVKGASRAAKAYLQLYDEVKRLDEENVSLSQQIELITESLSIGASLQKRMSVLVEEMKLVAREQLVKDQQLTEEKIERSNRDSLEVLQDILAKQDNVKETVSKNVEGSKTLEASLLANRNYLLVVTVIALFFGVVFSVAIVRLISKPLIRAVEIAQGIAGGNLDQKIDISGADEIGQLGSSLTTMVEKLRANHIELQGSVTTIDEVSSAVASSIEEISASMEEIFSMTQTNAEKAKMADKIGADAKENAGRGSLQVGDMVASMKEVDIASMEIAKIVKVIDGIAFQTKLLALNAAVEAAHAGERGQGFAVVAEEVRSLAGRCEEAVRDTNALIQGPIKKISHTVAIANQTAESFKTVTSNIQGMAELVKEIAKSSDEQVLGIRQTNEGISHIDNVAQGLSAQTDKLYSIMDRFKTSEVGELQKEYDNPEDGWDADSKKRDKTSALLESDFSDF